jgi:transcriptional regulator GlxA family with amidase domain
MPYRVDILAVDGALDSALAISLDVLSAANRIAQSLGHPVPFRARVLAPHKELLTGTKRRTVVDATLPRDSHCDVLIVLGMNVPEAGELEHALARPDVKAAIAFLHRSKAKLVAASCSGTFLCAEAKLLEGKSAATSWWLAPLFRRRYPNIRVSNEAMVVRDGRLVTAGAAFSHVDLMLWITRHLAGPVVAGWCTRYLVVDERPSQARYVATDQLAHESPEIARAEAYIRRHLGKPIRTAQVAKASGVSTRTLERHMKATIGLSPIAFIQRLRAEQAVHLAQTTALSVSEITHQVGYANETSLRRILVRDFGCSLQGLRFR